VTSERGFTLIELLVTVVAGLVIMLGLFSAIEVSTRNTLRVDRRVEANQRARPVLQRLLDQLHSTCLGPGMTPVLAGSTDSSMTYLSYTGSAVNPTPDKHVVTLTGSTLTETIYPATGGTAPNWTFSGTPSSTRELLAGVGAASIGNPPTNPPTFQYFAYVNGVLSSTPLTTPLTATDAAATGQVSVALGVAPVTTAVPDPNASVSVSDSAILRLSAPSEDPTDPNPPCA
jgi:prepilin-type N-terminal cleavage/methylation domain-containing protein